MGAAPAPGAAFGAFDPFDVAVVGAGVAGCEVAWRCARAGRRVLLATTSMDTVLTLAGDARVAAPEGTLLAELGAALAGPGGTVRAWELHRTAKERLERTPNVHLIQSDASALLTEADGLEGTGPASARESRARVVGFATWEGVPRRADAVVLAVGSFLRARLEAGVVRERAGRLGEMAYDDLHDDLAARGFAFEERRARGHGGEGGIDYHVAYRVLAATELEPLPGAPPGAARLPRLAGLWAAGLVAGSPLGTPGGADGYAAAAAAGRALGAALAD